MLFLKKLCLVLSLCFLVPLCACGKAGHQTYTLPPFSAVASFSFQNSDYQAQVTYNSPDDMEVSMLEPSTLKGLVFQQKSAEATVRFAGVTIQADDLAVLPLPSPVPLLLLRLLAAVGAGPLSVGSDGRITGALDDLTYELQVDPETGFPLRLATDDFACTFVNKT